MSGVLRIGGIELAVELAAQPLVGRNGFRRAGRWRIDALHLQNLDASHPRLGDRGADTHDGNGRERTLDHLGLPVTGG